jgi:hypothetical protein
MAREDVERGYRLQADRQLLGLLLRQAPVHDLDVQMRQAGSRADLVHGSDP